MRYSESNSELWSAKFGRVCECLICYWTNETNISVHISDCMLIPLVVVVIYNFESYFYHCSVSQYTAINC